MKRVKRAVCLLLLVALICAMATTGVFAADNGSVWLKAADTANGTAALIVTDTTVTDGLVEISYNSEALTYEGIETTAAYVAMHAVNTDEPGVIKISWVAPEAYAADGTGLMLIRVNFSGAEAESSLALTGKAQDAEGNAVPLTDAPDTTELEKAILEASGLRKHLYTEESFAALEEALAEAMAVLEDPTASQAEIDAATKALRDAMDALQLNIFPSPGGDTPGTPGTPGGSGSGSAGVDKSELEKAIAKAEGLEKSNYTGSSFKAVQDALKNAKAVRDDANATQAEVDAAAKALNDAIAALKLAGSTPDTGDDFALVPMICIALGSAACIAVLVVMLIKSEKKGRKAR